MKIYLKDGISMKVTAKDPDTVEIDMQSADGYIIIKNLKAPWVGDCCMMCFPKESVNFIDFENAEKAEVEIKIYPAL